MKGYRIYIFALLLASAFFVFTQSNREEEVDWTPNFLGNAKVPYGTFLLRDLMPAILPGSNVVESRMPIYNTLQNADRGMTYMIVNTSFRPDDLDLERILRFVEEGNTLFVAAGSFSAGFTDSLGIHVSDNWGISDTVRGDLVNPALRGTGTFSIRNGVADAHISKIDSATNIAVLGVNHRMNVNYVRIKRGGGTIFLNTEPYAFTNYNLLSGENLRYISGVMSYIPTGKVIWDEYYKYGRKDSDSPMRYILNQKSLVSALYLTLAGIFLFIVFMGRRRQRIIPTIPMPANATLEFVETMGRLYYDTGDHRDLAEKRITYFLESLRSRYGVNTSRRDEEFIRVVAGRTGVDPEQVRGLVSYIDHILALKTIDSDQLQRLNKIISNY